MVEARYLGTHILFSTISYTMAIGETAQYSSHCEYLHRLTGRYVVVVNVVLEPCRLGLVVSQPTSPSQHIQFFGTEDGHCAS